MCIGDIVGRSGRRAVRELLPELKQSHDIDLVIANGENAAGGVGITRKVLENLLDWGIDIVTSGNHVWDKKEVYKFIDDEQYPLLRPANYPPEVPGRGYRIFNHQGVKVGVINLLGQVFMGEFDCPFRIFDEIFDEIKREAEIIIVDFHAEATAEKVAFGWYADNRATAVVGTHTHIQTADEWVLPGGTGYISDLGMTGPINSVIGVKKDKVIDKFVTKLPTRFEVAKGEVKLCGVVLEINDISGRVDHIYRIQESLID